MRSPPSSSNQAPFALDCSPELEDEYGFVERDVRQDCQIPEPERIWVPIRVPPTTHFFIDRTSRSLQACRQAGLPASFASSAAMNIMMGGYAASVSLVHQVASTLPIELQPRGQEILRDAAGAGIKLMLPSESASSLIDRQLLMSAPAVKNFYIGITERPSARFTEQKEKWNGHHVAVDLC